MKRRHFLKDASMGAIAISTSGFIRYNGKTYVGDCQTTTDILGPFYRPNSPVRSDLVIKSMAGEIVKLKGHVIHDDCTTPLENAKIELWHCSADEVYDNDSDDFHYRGTTFCDKEGAYYFRTQMPVPYDAGGGMYRPAHFHLMVSAPGYQNLVTQLYFAGDPYLEKDASSKADAAKSRILKVEKMADRSLVIPFDVIMLKQLPVDASVIDRLIGTYRDEADPGRFFEFFMHEDQLWLKNEVFGQNFMYLGDNTFELPDRGSWGTVQIHFEILKKGGIKATRTQTSSTGEKRIQRAIKK